MIGVFQNFYFVIFYETLKATLGPTCHWIYASQYTKTLWLTSGIIKKACLVSYKHHKTLGSSSLMQIPITLQPHEIEMELNQQKDRSKQIKRVFLIVDTVLIILIPCLQCFMLYLLDYIVKSGGNFQLA